MKILVDEMPKIKFQCPFGIVNKLSTEDDTRLTCSLSACLCNYEPGKSECNGLKVFKFSNEDMSVILRQALQPAT